MILYSNKSVVLRLIQKAAEKYPSWELGKKALQKSLYFFNLKSGRFNFRWADFGPMSGEVQQIVRDLEAVGRVKVDRIETKKQNAFLHRVEYVQKEPQLEVSSDLDESLDATIGFVAKRSSRDLELLASVHFWAVKSDGKDTVEYVHRMLEELKPDAKFTKENVEGAVLKLRKNGFLPDVMP